MIPVALMPVQLLAVAAKSLLLLAMVAAVQHLAAVAKSLLVILVQLLAADVAVAACSASCSSARAVAAIRW